MNDLQLGYDIVWTWRSENEWFPAPPVGDYEYAGSEAGEMMDAKKRAERPDDLRNADKEHSVETEAADTAFMLYTGLGPDVENEIEWSSFNPKYGRDPRPGYIFYLVGLTLVSADEKKGMFALLALENIAALLGADFIPLLHSRLQRIAATRKPRDLYPELSDLHLEQCTKNILLRGLPEFLEDRNRDNPGRRGRLARSFVNGNGLVSFPIWADRILADPDMMLCVRGVGQKRLGYILEALRELRRVS